MKQIANDQSPEGGRAFDSILCAMATAVYFAFVLPLQTYLANAESFTFGLGDVVCGCCLRMLCLAVPVGILLAVTNRWCKGRLHLLFIGLLLATMIESGPGALGLPELNGEFAGYRDIVRGTLDIVILVIVVVAPVLLRKWLKDYVGLISICLMLFTASSLFDVKKAQTDSSASDDRCVQKLVPRTEVLQCAKFSPKNNVILLVLDSVASYVVQDILGTDPGLASAFEGFINYTRNIGMHSPTQVGLPGLLTGMYFQSSRDISRYGRSYYSKDSVIAPYVGKNIPVYFNVALGVNGYTNRQIGEYEAVKPTGLAVFKDRIPGIFALTIDDICVFRILPYLLKERFLLSCKGEADASVEDPLGAGVKEKSKLKINLSNDHQVWSFLSRCSIDDNCQQTFHVHHTNGGHLPIVYDENGNEVKCPHPKYEDYRRQCKFSLRSVAEMLGVWKTNGVYDVSTIIIAADHGSRFERPGMDYPKIPASAFPVLMLKPKGVRGEYCESDLPTTHANVSKVIKLLASKVLNRAEMEQVLATDEPRLFRLASSGKLNDWYVSKDGSFEFKEQEDSEPAIESLNPLEYDVDYDFRPGDDVAYPDFRVEQGTRAGGGLSTMGNEMIVYIKVPASCTITFCGTTFARSEDEAFVDLELNGEHREFKAELSQYKTTTCKIESVVPDENGVVKILFKKNGSLNFVLKKIKLLKTVEKQLE